MKALLLILALATSSWAQSIRWSGTTGDVALGGQSYKVTIQQPASGAKAVSLETAVIYCSAAVDITQAQNGTAANTAAMTLSAITNTGGSPVTKAWKLSNVGAGTAVGGIFHHPGVATVVLDLSKVSLPATSSTAINYSIILGAATATCNVTIYGGER